MMFPLKEIVKSFKRRRISQCSLGMSNDVNSTEFEADAILSSRQINNIQNVCK